LEIPGEFDELSLNAGGINFNGASKLTVAGSVAFNFSSTNTFTCECWIYQTATPTNYCRLVQAGSNGVQSTITMLDIGSDLSIAAYIPNGAGQGTRTVANVITNNTWYHVAVVFTGGVVKIFVNGILCTNSVTGSFSALTSLNNILYLGGDTASGANSIFSGCISNLRILNGTALYTSNFTPPQNILPSITNTSLLLNVNTATNFVQDNSPNNFTLTTSSGAPIWIQYSPFSYTPVAGSVYLSGSSALSIAGSTAFNFSSTNTFTVECWIYQTTTPTDQCRLVIAGPNNAQSSVILLAINSDLSLTCAIPVATPQGVQTVSNVITNNAWYYISAVLSGGVVKIFVNGILCTNASSSAVSAITSANNSLTIGYDSGSPAGATSVFRGYITNLRILNGTALYSASYTPPTAPLTAITNTQLLLNVANATNYIKDSSSNNFTLTPVGSPIWNPAGPFN
jgi:hypothetical protein